MQTNEYQLRREAEAAKIIAAGIKAEFGEGDADLIADSIEGETDLLEAIDAALGEIDESEILITGLKEKEGQLASRRRSMEERVKRVRSLIEQAMAITEQARIRRAAATLTLRKLPPDIVVVAEADIPADFFVPQPPPPPKLNKAALKDALIAREKQAALAAELPDEEKALALAALPMIPGAVLNNGGFSLQIRRS